MKAMTNTKRKTDNAVHFYTEGIQINCKDEEVIAKLYSNRATAHLRLGKSSKRVFSDCLSIFAPQ